MRWVFAILLMSTGCTGGVRSASDEVPIAQACAGLPEAMMDRGVADLRANVDAVEPLREREGEKALPRLVGAAVGVRAAPGMTPQWLGRMLQCDTARHAAASLVPSGARSVVTVTPVGFTVAVRSHDPELAREIHRRATLFARPTSAACNTREYLWNEATNLGGPGRCASDCDCDGLRTCLAGACQGTAR